MGRHGLHVWNPRFLQGSIPELKKIVSAYAGIYVVYGAVAQGLTINVWAIQELRQSLLSIYS